MLGMLANIPLIGKLVGKVVDHTVETTPTLSPPTEDQTSQYSPSISHDEDTPNDEVDEWEVTKNNLEEWDDKPGSDTGSKEEDSEEWEDFGDDSGASGGGGEWSGSVRGGGSVSVPTHKEKPLRTPSANSSRSGGMQLKLSRSATSSHAQPATPPADSSTSSSSSLHKPSILDNQTRTTKHKTSTSSSSDFRVAMKGRLSEQDLVRLEAKKAFTVKEPDFFADMEPTFASSTQSSSTSQLSPREGRKDTSSSHSLSSAMQYQPEEESSGWGEEEWNDF